MSNSERRSEILHLSEAQVAAAVQQVLPGFQLARAVLTDAGRANTNYIVEGDEGCYVLRVYVRNSALCAKERALHALVGSSVAVARIVGSGILDVPPNPTFNVLEFIPGQSLERLAALHDQKHLLTAAHSLGRVLATLTTFRFECSGDLQNDASELMLRVVPWSFGEFYRWCLFESPAAARLGKLRERLWACIERRRELPADNLPIHLTHGDFNPSNLLIGEHGEVKAVLDWEFAHAGKLWSDLGNLLRRRPEFSYPNGFENALVQGLGEGGVALPSDWREQAEFDDLSSACEFLSSQEERPVTHARALRQIEETLARIERGQFTAPD